MEKKKYMSCEGIQLPYMLSPMTHLELSLDIVAGNLNL